MLAAETSTCVAMLARVALLFSALLRPIRRKAFGCECLSDLVVRVSEALTCTGTTFVHDAFFGQVADGMSFSSLLPRAGRAALRELMEPGARRRAGPKLSPALRAPGGTRPKADREGKRWRDAQATSTDSFEPLHAALGVSGG